MKAFVVERYGDADTVRAGEVPDPKVGAHDVLVRIPAANVNPVDLKIRDGYSYLFMKASGDQLRELSALIDAGIIRPVVDRVFDFDQTREALAHVEQGRTKAGKVVVRMS